MRVAVLDVNETLVDLRGLDERMAAAGGRPEDLPRWFAGVLRDGLALAAAGASAPFGELARANLRTLGLDAPGAAHVLAGLGELPLQPDVPVGLRALADGGLRLVVLTNGDPAVGRGALERAGLGDLVERHLTVADAPRWKPAPEAYALAVDACGEPPAELVLVAAHPWDVDGARRAGLRGGWVNRGGAPCPAFLPSPDAQGEDLPALARALLGAA